MKLYYAECLQDRCGDRTWNSVPMTSEQLKKVFDHDDATVDLLELSGPKGTHLYIIEEMTYGTTFPRAFRRIQRNKSGTIGGYGDEGSWAISRVSMRAARQFVVKLEMKNGFFIPSDWR